jgi:hypothetical protein
MNHLEHMRLVCIAHYRSKILDIWTCEKKKFLLNGLSACNHVDSEEVSYDTMGQIQFK